MRIIPYFSTFVKIIEFTRKLLTNSCFILLFTIDKILSVSPEKCYLYADRSRRNPRSGFMLPHPPAPRSPNVCRFFTTIQSIYGANSLVVSGYLASQFMSRTTRIKGCFWPRIDQVATEFLDRILRSNDRQETTNATK